MSFYHSSSNSNYLSNSHLSYNYSSSSSPSSSPTSSGTDYNSYRSQMNLRPTKPSYHFQYQPHFYVPPPSFMSLKKPLIHSSLSAHHHTTETMPPKTNSVTIIKTSSRESLNSCSDDTILPVKRIEPAKSEPTRSQSVSNLSTIRNSDFELEKPPNDNVIAPFRPSESNDLAATAISNIQLNHTDDLMTQVDYFLNEVSWKKIHF